jgi:hypothetical protein
MTQQRGRHGRGGMARDTDLPARTELNEAAKRW